MSLASLADSPLVRLTGYAWRWWTACLLSLLPPAWRHGLALEEETVILTLTTDPMQIVLRRLPATRVQRALALDIPTEKDWEEVIRTQIRPVCREAHVTLELPTDWLLQRVLELPLAVDENLRPVLRFELDRYTPFTSDQVYYDYQRLQRDKVNKKLRVLLVVVPRRYVDEWRERLSRAAIPVQRITGTGLSAINLLPSGHRRRWTVRDYLKPLSGIGLLLLLTIALLTPLWQMHQVVLLLHQSLHDLQHPLQQVEALRQQQQRLAEDVRFLRDLRLTQPSTITLFEELSQRLPDTTWLYELRLSNGLLTIQGESANAADLIRVIEASPYFHNTAFQSPITKQGERELFQLATQIVMQTTP